MIDVSGDGRDNNTSACNVAANPSCGVDSALGAGVNTINGPGDPRRGRPPDLLPDQRRGRRGRVRGRSEQLQRLRRRDREQAAAGDRPGARAGNAAAARQRSDRLRSAASSPQADVEPDPFLKPPRRSRRRGGFRVFKAALHRRPSPGAAGILPTLAGAAHGRPAPRERAASVELRPRDRVVQLKFVYYGPAVGGKTTNLQLLHAAALRPATAASSSRSTRTRTARSSSTCCRCAASASTASTSASSSWPCPGRRPTPPRAGS